MNVKTDNTITLNEIIEMLQRKHSSPIISLFNDLRKTVYNYNCQIDNSEKKQYTFNKWIPLFYRYFYFFNFCEK